MARLGLSSSAVGTRRLIAFLDRAGLAACELAAMSLKAVGEPRVALENQPFNTIRN